VLQPVNRFVVSLAQLTLKAQGVLKVPLQAPRSASLASCSCEA
jgi:hypothetical protein